jgi:hydrogenase-4 membrane subunit HyfE
MKKIDWIIWAISIFIVVAIGYYIFLTMNYTFENHPEITEIEIFAPPRFDLMLVTVILCALVCGLALKFGKVEEDKVK